jgi:hypothetical protein
MISSDARLDSRHITVDDTASDQSNAWLMLAIGTIVIASAPLLHGTSALLTIALLTFVGVVVSLRMPAQAPFLAVFWILFQNIFVSIFSPVIASASELEIIKGYNFLLCAVTWLAFSARSFLARDERPAVWRLMVVGWSALAVVLVFFCVGFLSTGMAAVIYLRNIVFPIFLFQIFLLAASRYDVRLRPALTIIGVIFVCCGYAELMFRDAWLDITNGADYWRFEEIKAMDSGVWEREMRATGNVIVTLKDRFTFGFFNTPLLDGLGLPDLLRIFGPNLHAISFAYGLIFFVLLFASAGLPWLALAAMPLAILTGVKGPFILMAIVVGSWVLTYAIGAVRTLILAVVAMCIYIAIGVYLGLQIGDYHVIGFMGGWNGLLANPLGRGIGFGGNLTQDFASIDWSAAQQAGAVDGAFESAVGVLFYQMGIFAAAPLGFILYVGFRAWLLFARSGNLIEGFAAFGILAILANGVFQEEALFSPPALGMLMSLAGLLLGTAIRKADAAR